MITGVGPGRAAVRPSDSVTTPVRRRAAPRPPLVRPRPGRVLAGVAAGTAAHLRQDPLLVRVAFVVLALAGVGVVALRPALADHAGGRARAPSRLRRPSPGAAAGRSQLADRARWCSASPRLVGQVVTLAAAPTSSSRWSWWRPAWRSSGGSWTPTARWPAPACRWLLAGGVVAGRPRRRAAAGHDRAAGRRPQRLRRHRWSILAGVVLATAPLWRRLLDSRDEERAARVRSEERAAVAAHLHDSVLQTLALIQRHADEPQAVQPAGPRPGARAAGLAVRARTGAPRRHLGGAGRRAWWPRWRADHALTVDPVVVGDAPVDEPLAALGAATREALVNAAKHSGVPSADLYTEVAPGRGSRSSSATAGKGFDPDVRARRPPRAARLGHRPAEPAGRHGAGPLRARGGDRGGAGAAEGERGHDHRGDDMSRARDFSRVRPAAGVPRRRPRDGARRACARSWGPTSRWSARHPTSPLPWRASGRRGPTSSCSTCTCPAAAGARCSRALRAELPEVRWLALSVSDAAEDVIARHPRRGPWLRHQDDLRPGPARRRPPGGRRRRRLQPPAGRVRAGRLRRDRSGPRRPRRTLPPTPGWTCSAPASARSCSCSPAATPTARSATRLFISVKTVESHASNVLRKLQLSNRNELTRWAATNRLL